MCVFKCECPCVNANVCACVRERDSFFHVCLWCLSVCVLVSSSFQCETHRRDGCTMRQSAYTCVNSCLPCPQVPCSFPQPADEFAGGRLQRLDQLAVSVSSPPVYAVWRGKFTSYLRAYVHSYVFINAYLYVRFCVFVFVCVFMCMCMCVAAHSLADQLGVTVYLPRLRAVLWGDDGAHVCMIVCVFFFCVCGLLVCVCVRASTQCC